MLRSLLISLILLQTACAFPNSNGASARLAKTWPQLASRRTGLSDVLPEHREELNELFNAQVTKELEASQLYLAASIWCDQNELVGMAGWMREESAEERSHALAFIDFAMKRDVPLTLQSIPAPMSTWGTIEELWTDVLRSEDSNTRSLLDLADCAMECHDHGVNAFLQPFHMEQINAEDNIGTILAKVKDENKTPGLLRQLDSELGGKVDSTKVDSK